MPSNRVEQQLRQVAAISDAQRADGSLLEAFLADRDEAAFTVLVRRYGPMVLGICRRVLRHEADAEDAFQAAFLVLVRRAAEVRCRASLGNWLYGVAYRTALHARTTNARRRRIEGQVRPMERNDSPEDAAMRPEVQTLLDQELNRLPAKYREIVVLCDLLGKTKREAAQQLQCPEGTVSSRLARGRELLRKRLTRRDVTLSLGALTVFLAQNKAPASAPLIETTVKAAALLAAGNVLAVGGLTPHAATLMEGVLKSMLLTKLKIVAGLILVLTFLGATTSWIACHAMAAAQPTPQADSVPGEKVAHAKDEKPPVERARLRYDGKDFTHWQNVLRNELKPEVRIEAFKALGAFGVNGYAEEATSTILEVVRGYEPAQMTDGDWEVLDTGHRTLARIGPEALPALTKMYETGKLDERRFVISTLYYMNKSAEVVTLLFRAAKDKEAVVRQQAVGSLQGVHPKTKELTAVLTGALTDEDTSVRRAAVNSLIVIGPEPSTLVPLLTTAIEQDKDRDIRNLVNQYFHSLGPDHKDYVPTLIDALKNPRHPVGLRRMLVRVVGQIGPAAKEAMPVLLDLLADKDLDPGLRDETAQALKLIQPSTTKPQRPK